METGGKLCLEEGGVENAWCSQWGTAGGNGFVDADGCTSSCNAGLDWVGARVPCVRAISPYQVWLSVEACSPALLDSVGLNLRRGNPQISPRTRYKGESEAGSDKGEF